MKSEDSITKNPNARMALAPYTHHNKVLARNLRSQMTDAEKILWKLLRDRRFVDYKFRRQVPIGPYIADFVCLAARLIVEADGSQHAENMRDRIRDQWFVDHGFCVRRIWNIDIHTRRSEVMDAIWCDLTREMK